MSLESPFRPNRTFYFITAPAVNNMKKVASCPPPKKKILK